jgi:hypothetical protein
LNSPSAYCKYFYAGDKWFFLRDWSADYKITQGTVKGLVEQPDPRLQNWLVEQPFPYRKECAQFRRFPVVTACFIEGRDRGKAEAQGTTIVDYINTNLVFLRMEQRRLRECPSSKIPHTRKRRGDRAKVLCRCCVAHRCCGSPYVKY